MTNLVSRAHTVGQSAYHLEWCTKYRYKMLRKPRFIIACEQAVREAAQRAGIVVLELSVMPEHVHALVVIPPTVSVSKALSLLKGASSRALFQLEPKFRLRYSKGHFWSRGSFYRSVGDADLETVSRYIREDNDPWQRLLPAY